MWLDEVALKMRLVLKDKVHVSCPRNQQKHKKPNTAELIRSRLLNNAGLCSKRAENELTLYYLPSFGFHCVSGAAA